VRLERGLKQFTAYITPRDGIARRFIVFADTQADARTAAIAWGRLMWNQPFALGVRPA
jgi:hypothetical protein